jgi:hypothetical protein
MQWNNQANDKEKTGRRARAKRIKRNELKVTAYSKVGKNFDQENFDGKRGRDGAIKEKRGCR